MSETISPTFTFVKHGVYYFSRRIPIELVVITHHPASPIHCAHGQQKLLMLRPLSLAAMPTRDMANSRSAF